MSTSTALNSSNVSNHSGDISLGARRAKVGLLVLLAAITSLFFLFTIALVIRSQLFDWEHLSAPWKPLANPWFLWVNTAMLVLASAALQWARVAARNGRLPATIKGLLLGGIFSVTFIVGQWLVWRQLVSLGYWVNSNPANSFFYLLTGLHALHLFGGLVAWLRTCVKAAKGIAMKQLSASVELCAIYWHYLLGLWLFLFALLTSSPETFAAIAELCGIDISQRNSGF